MPKLGTGLAGELGMKRRDNPAAYSREWTARHREERKEYARSYHAKRKAEPAYMAMKKEAAKVSRRKHKYNITREEYDALLFKQEGRCTICGEFKGTELRVDHDHQTGEVRSLLCAQCNTGLGMFYEDPEIMFNAIAYLKRYMNKEG